MTATPTVEAVCENCGAEGPLAPTPHGLHCEHCYAKVMDDTDKPSPSCDDTGIYDD